VSLLDFRAGKDKIYTNSNDVYINGGKHLDDVSHDLYAIKKMALL
jgi:hypothetical protein